MEIAILPNGIIKYLSKNYSQQNDLNILFSNIIIISFIIIFKDSVIYSMNLIPHFCLIDKLFGVECPFCGTTRAFCELSKGDINKSIHLNFTSIFIALFFIIQIPLRLITLINRKNRIVLYKISKHLSFLILTIVLCRWIFILLY